VLHARRRNTEVRKALLDDLDRLLAQQAQAVGKIRLGRREPDHPVADVGDFGLATAGFGRAYATASVTALAVALLAVFVVPAGRPAATGSPHGH